MNRRALLSVLAKSTLLVVSLFFSLVMGEVFLRLLGYQAIYEIYSKPSVLWQHDRLLGWSHEPGSRTTYVGPRPWPIEFENEISINTLGLRGPEVSPLPPDGVRILALGDSMVAAFEVTYPETFTAVTGGLLTEELGATVQIVNAGVRGYGTDQSYLYYRERGEALAPDVVLMWLSVNDLVNDVTIHRMRRIFGKPVFVPDGQGGITLLGAPVPEYPHCSEYRVSAAYEIVRHDGLSGRILCRLQMTLFDRSALFSFVTHLLPWESWGALLRDLYYMGMPDPGTASRAEAADSEGGSAPVITDLILRALKRDVEADGARLFLVSTPQMLQRFREAGVGLDDYSVIALGQIEGEDRAAFSFKHDSHLNAKGHRVVADVLRDELLPVVREVRAARLHEAAR